MNVPIVIGAPFVTAEKFAEMTGQSVCSVKEQIKNNQLPTYVLPASARQKDPSSERRKRFVDMSRLLIEGFKRAGSDPLLKM
jgi:hypothetical protein